MNKYLITYDLKNKGIKSYESLYRAIKTIGPWWHYLDSTWIVKSNLSSKQIWNLLAPHLLKDDRVLVTKMDANDKYGWLPAKA